MADKVIKFETIHNTGMACPTQYFGNLSDGRAFYIRYRFGWFTLKVTIIPIEWNIYMESNDIDDELFFETQYGDEWDGCIEHDELIEILKSHPELFDISEIEKI